jgi:hypothetical protein
MNPVISICVFLFAAIVFGAGAAYRAWIRPIICDHFGEEYRARGNGDAKKRRRSFERLCGQIAASLFAAGFIAAIPDFNVPIPPGVIGASEMVTTLVAGLLCWAAIARWNAPYDSQ